MRDWKLSTTYRDQGFEVLGFPANDFGNQEPGSAKDIDQFCKVNYGVSLPLFAKAPVSGKTSSRFMPR
jgi:glutathione peroxidase